MYCYPDAENKPGKPAVKNVSLEIGEGEYVAVLGHNGSGKSTLAKLLNMILSPDSGKIIIAGRDLSAKELTEEEIFLVRRDIGMVFQNPDNQLVATVVEEDVAFGPENLGIEPKEIRKRVDDALALVGMTEFAHHAPHRLSGGQKQRIAIAGVIAMMPKCIIFDESTAMLDPIGRREVTDTMEKLNRENGITIINITHNMEEAVRADRIMVMNEGEIYLEGTPREVFSKTDALKAAGLEAPQPTELLVLLNTDYGFDFPVPALENEECASVIAKEYERYISGNN